MLWGVVDCKPAPKGVARLGSEGGAQRVLAVGVEIIHDEMNCRRRRIPSRDSAKRASELFRRSVLRGVRHVTSRFRLDDAEDVRRAAPDVFVVLSRDASRSSGSPWPGWIPQYDRTFIERDHWRGHVQGLRQSVEQVVHPRHVLLVQLWHAPHFFPATA